MDWLNALQILRAVDKGKRPSLVDTNSGENIVSGDIQTCGILDVMKSCWQHEPNDRPSAAKVRELTTQIALGVANS